MKMKKKKKKSKSSARRDNEEQEKKTEFYRIIHPSVAADYETKLKLPPEFVSKFGSSLSDFATLRVANGDFLRVGLTTMGRDIWFGNGWREFVGRYAIHEGSFLFFQYTGCSRFSVTISDETATEIEYPCNGDLGAGKGPSDDQQHPVKDKPDAEYQAHCAQFTSPMKAIVSNHTPRAVPSVLNPTRKIEKDRFLGKKKTRIKCKAKNAVISVDGKLSDGFGLVSVGDAEAIPEASNYQPENPYFRIHLRSCDIISGSILHVPVEFSDKYLDKASEYMKLLAPGGRKWLVELVWKLGGGVEFRNGWYQFASGNELKEGDECVIEFLEAEMEFKVSIFRAA